MKKESRLSFMEKTRTIGYYIVHTNCCRALSIQWRFGYNYNTCSDIIDILERLGVVSEFDMIKLKRTILVGTIEELEEKLDFYF